MNLSIVTSFVVSGILLVSILALNNQVTRSSTETTLDIISKNRVDFAKDLISQDFNRIGFGTGSQINAISSNHINFKADIHDEGTKVVNWILPPGKPADGTTNPNDKILQRIGSLGGSTGNTHKVEIPVINFELTGYRDVTCENETVIPGELKCIQVELVYESPEPVMQSGNGEDIYNRTTWRKTFVPSNIQF